MTEIERLQDLANAAIGVLAAILPDLKLSDRAALEVKQALGRPVRSVIDKSVIIAALRQSQAAQGKRPGD